MSKLKNFLSYSATAKLQELAKSPIDLTDQTVLTSSRLEKYLVKGCGYKLFYGTERISDKVMEALHELATEACVLDQMHRMQDGEVVNYIQNYPSEKRPALHTALRDLFEHPRQAKCAKEATALAEAELKKLKEFLEEIDKNKIYDEIISIGIGGSDLGPRATYYALEYLIKPGRKVHFVSNVDPDDAALILKNANLQKCLVVVISKSGTTLETKINEDLVRTEFLKAGIDPNDRFISITTPNSMMDDKKRYRKTFYLWDWVGGRYSVTSMVGGVVLAFAFGFNTFYQFLEGANAMDKLALNPNISENLPLLMALIGIWNHNFLNCSTVALIPYSQGLLRYPAHIQQVQMESNGKSINQEGESLSFQTSPIIWGEPGTNGQHSFFQLLHQGTAVVPLIMIGYKKNQYQVDIEVEGTTSQEKLLANLFAQSLSLAMGKKESNPNKCFPGNRPSQMLLGEQLNPYSLGALLALFEHMVAFQGFIWGVNSFDQEGVQLGKVMANHILEEWCSLKERKAENSRESSSLASVYLKELNQF